MNVQSILKTLPISYYLKRKLNVKISETAYTSSIDIMHDELTIAINNVNSILSATDCDMVPESIIRSLLYHEVSHAMLTPIELTPSDELNIFEDERIETILRDYYMNINFKKACRLLNHYSEEQMDNPTSVRDLYFNLVRFRKLPTILIKNDPYNCKLAKATVSMIISDFKKLNRFSSKYECYQYIVKVDNLYELCKKLFKEFLKAKEEEEVKTESEPAPETESTSKSESESESESESTSKSEVDSDPESESDSEAEDNSETESESDSETEIEDVPDVDEANESDARIYDKDIEDLSKEYFGKYDNSTLDTKVQMIFSDLLKKNKRNGSSIASYSGKFDPRLTVRDDCKFFTQANRLGHIKNNAKIKLNLFIDRSGSFLSSQEIINQLIKSLSKFEAINPNFSMDLITIGMSEVLHDRSDRKFRACGGNRITSNLPILTKNVQTNGYTNINIVCFDGDALTDCGSWCAQYFSAFNAKNFIIISDDSNKRYFDRYCPTARATYTRSYANELIIAIFNALKGAMA